jgi:hypothetical protein
MRVDVVSGANVGGCDAYFLAVADDRFAGRYGRQGDFVAARDRLRRRDLSATVEAQGFAGLCVGDDDGDVVAGID